MKKLLVVVDMQNDFVTGALGTEEARRILPAVSALVSGAEEDGTEVVFTQDTHGRDYLCTREGKNLPVPHCIRGTHGWEIVPGLAKAGARVFEKGTFGSEALARYVRENAFEEVTFCGVCTDICVVSNALLVKAFSPEAQVRAVRSACAGTTPEKHDAALATMESCQIAVLA